MNLENCTSVLWKREFSDVLEEIPDALSTQRSAEELRFIMSTGLVSLDDMVKDPEKFFLAHRMLARQIPRMGSSLWIRFVLQYNLFAGSVCALGSPWQIRKFMERNAERPLLGCFALAEQRPGQVDTVAEVSPDETHIILSTTTDMSAKTWISQGLIADEALVLETMVVHGHSYGPQAFLIKLRDNDGTLLPGITLLDMGPKDAGGDLDNARITFDKVRIPLSTHLSRYLEFKNGTVVHHAGKRVSTLEIIGKTLNTGRIAVSQAALTSKRAKLEIIANNFDASSVCWTPMLTPRPRARRAGHDGKPKLTKRLIAEAFHNLDRLNKFAERVEAELCVSILHQQEPKERTLQAISVLKVEAVEICIEIMATIETPNNCNLFLGHDFLKCCKFAEGDTNALMQKMTRDLIHRNSSNSSSKALSKQVDAALDDLQRELMLIEQGNGCSSAEAWDRCGELVYVVAEAHMDEILQSYGCLVNVVE